MKKIKKGSFMTYKEFIRKSDNLRRKRDIIILAELLDLYDDYYNSKKKEPINPLYVYNEICDSLIYSEEEKEQIINLAQILRNKQNLLLILLIYA